MSESNVHVAHCTCGNLSIEASQSPDWIIACHCLSCQRRTGSPFGLGAYYNKAQIVTTSGAAQAYTRPADSGRTLTNYFCPTCGTVVYWDLEMRPEHVGIAVGCFADPTFAAPERTIWTQTQHSWVCFPPELPAFSQAMPESN